VVVNAVNLFMQVFFTIMYSDLEVSAAPREDGRFVVVANVEETWR
jgi:hypothetical protein